MQTPKINWVGHPSQDPNWIAPKCVIGLDRDGTINVDRGHYVWQSDDFEPIQGSLEAIAQLRRLGHKIVILTNQGGIETGEYTQEDVDNLHQHMLELLGEAGCFSIDGIYYSASRSRKDPFVKPNTGMFKRCEREIPHIKFSQGYYVGDKISDLKAAARVGATPVLVRTGYGQEAEELLGRFTYRDLKKKALIFNNLAEFADWMAD